MRLTPDHVLQAEQTLNCIGDRELVLRGMGIPAIENLAVARDGFDVIDLSSNMIVELGHGFPPFPRLTSLYLGSNRISSIKRGIADSLPNLQVLVLSSNKLNTVEDLNVKELSRLSKLEILSISDNPVANQPGVRQLLIDNIPTLKVVNFRKVSLAEKQEAERERTVNQSKKRKRETNRGRSMKRRRVKTFDVGSLESDFTSKGKASKDEPTPLTSEQSEALKCLIETAETIEQVTRIQNAIRNGRISDILGTPNSKLKATNNSKVS